MKVNYSTIIIGILTLVLSVLVIHLALIKINSANIQTVWHQLILPFSLEPDTPINLDDPPFHQTPFPENEVSILTVIDKGTEIPLQFIYNNPSWERPAFKSYWHSKYGRWSYVPTRIHYALHRVFSTYATASIYYDFIHDLGIAEESKDFKNYEYQTPYDFIIVVVMNTSIDRIVTYKNQIVITGTPQRTGLQAIIIPTAELHPEENTQNLLIHLATPDGYEIDYTTEVYIHPDAVLLPLYTYGTSISSRFNTFN